MNAKSAIAPLMACALAASLVGCVEMGPPPPSASFPASFDPVPTAKALPATVAFDADAINEDNLDDTFGVSNKVVIPRFTVSFVISRGVAAGTSDSSAQMEVILDGVELQTLQAITDAAYADFVAQLKAAGREVVDAATMRSSQSYHAFDFYDPSGQRHYLQEASFASPTTVVTLNPTGLPMYFLQMEGDNGPFDQVNFKAQNALSAELQAVVVTPNLVVDFAKVDSSGHSRWVSGSTSVGAEPLLHLGSGGKSTFGQTTVRMTFAENAMGGEMGWMTAEGWVSPAEGADRFALSSKKLSGSEGDGYASSRYAFVANPAVYQSTSLALVQAMDAAWMTLVKDNAP